MPLPNYLVDEDEDGLDPEGAAPPVAAPPWYAALKASGGPSPVPLPDAPDLGAGDAGSVPSSPVGGIAPQPSGPQAQDEPRMQGVIGALQREQQLRGQRPAMPQPKWWQRVLAAGVGGMAGAANAQGKRMIPIDPTQAEQNILAPGYARKLADWQARVQQAQADTQGEVQKLSIPEQIRKMQADTAEAQATGNYHNAQAAYQTHRAQMEQNQWKIDPRTGQLINTITGEVKQRAATLADRIKEAKDAGLSDEEAKVYATGGKITQPSPKTKSTDEQIYETAIRSVAAKRGIQLDPNRDLISQLPVDAQIEAAQQHAAIKADPQMRDLALAIKQGQVASQPTKDQAQAYAADLVNHRLAPDQFGMLVGGFGAQGQAFKRMVYVEAKKMDPNFDFEQASADYQFSKNPGFQNTVRFMDSALNSIPRFQSAANALANGKVRSINALINAGRYQFNSVDLKRFQTDRTLVGDEIAKILQGGGTGSGTSDVKLKQAQDIFKDSDDPAVIATALQEVSTLLGYRRNTLVRGTYMENRPRGSEGGASSGQSPAAGARPPLSQIFGQ